MSKENIVLWIGNFRPIKQPEVFISIANSFVNRNIKFVMIGVQGKYIYTDLPKNLEMKGFLNNSEVVNYLRRSKVLINTSLTEGFSNTFLEAWINNVFVLSLNVNPDNLLNGRLGMCTNGSMHLLSKKLDEIINNKSFDFKSVGDSFKDIISEFDLNSNIVKLISVIDSLKS
jgi:glycosyltransferase involved in cell wall biosynthesis